MSESPDEFVVLQSVVEQLQNGGTVLTLPDAHRTVFLQIMEQSIGHSTDEIAERMLRTFENQKGESVQLDALDASAILQEIRPLVPSSPKNALITMPVFTTRMDDMELCEIICTQLGEKGEEIILPETEIYQLVDIINRSYQEHPEMEIFKKVGSCLRHLKIHSILPSGENMISIALPSPVAREFYTMIIDAKPKP